MAAIAGDVLELVGWDASNYLIPTESSPVPEEPWVCLSIIVHDDTCSWRIICFRAVCDLNFFLVQVPYFNSTCQSTPEDKVTAAMWSTCKRGSAGSHWCPKVLAVSQHLRAQLAPYHLYSQKFVSICTLPGILLFCYNNTVLVVCDTLCFLQYPYWLFPHPIIACVLVQNHSAGNSSSEANFCFLNPKKQY